MPDPKVGQFGHNYSNVLTTLGKGKKTNNCSCAPSPDTQVLNGTQNLQDAVTGFVYNHAFISSPFLGLVSSVFNFFNPFVDLVNKLDNHDNKDQTHGVTAGQFTVILKDILAKIRNDENINKNLSKDSKEELEELNQTVLALSERKDLQNLDLTELIQRWRHTRDTQALFDMAEVLRNQGKDGNQGIKFTDEELRKTFVNGLESLAQALNEIMKHPSGENRGKAAGKITQAADDLVDGTERLQERGSDEDLTTGDKQFIGGKLKSATEHVQHVMEDKSLAPFLGNAFSGLYTWYCDTIRFLSDWCNEDKEEERKKEQELCAKRQEEKKEIIKYCAMMRNAKSKRILLSMYMDYIRSKMFQLLLMRESAKGHNTGRYYFAKNEIFKNGSNYDYSKCKYLEESIKEIFYEGKENDIRSSLPPSTVCDPLGMNLELDIIC